MPNYKRKKVKHKLFQFSKKTKDDFVKDDELEIDEEVFEKKSEKSPKRVKFNVHKGKAKKPTKNFLYTLIVLVIVIGAIVISSIFLPIGIIDTGVNFVKTIGVGDYPLNFDSTIVRDVVCEGGYYYVLTDTSLSAYSKAGKEIFIHSHGLSNPMLSVSASRALVYDQGGNTVLLYNLKGLLKKITKKETVITATVGRNGAYAIVTDGSEYTSSVSVYSKNFKRLYSWNSAKDIINSVCISPYSKKIAVSLLNASGGKFVSKLLVFDFNSADPKFNSEYNDNVIYSIRGTFFGFSAITKNEYSYYSWSDYEKTEHTVSDNSINCYKTAKEKTIIVFDRVNNKTVNVVKIISTFGNEKNQFSYNGNITDIVYSNGKVYILSDTKVVIADKKGNVLKSKNTDINAEKIAVINSDTVALISDEGINKFSVSK